ncbi:hypothetical protein EVAR_9984_1 [Eumeta japonica]|uniref:Uncharacterized protein n=1 Tax=Eumeta variegata TaxID=151549 RepID=A0A4C1TQY4_EUMVA|nr:hypothetical protein EVAR_9984_1 [Eumeta japonica]
MIMVAVTLTKTIRYRITIGDRPYSPDSVLHGFYLLASAKNLFLKASAGLGPVDRSRSSHEPDYGHDAATARADDHAPVHRCSRTSTTAQNVYKVAAASGGRSRVGRRGPGPLPPAARRPPAPAAPAAPSAPHLDSRGRDV